MFTVSKSEVSFWLDIGIVVISTFVLVADLWHLLVGGVIVAVFVVVAIIGLGPVLINALRTLTNRKVTIDLLASGINIFFAQP